MDIKCIVCGEPWDFVGAANGEDMERWEFELVKRGAGCPSCEGKDDGSYSPSEYEDIECGDEDPIDRIMAMDPAMRPKWEKPTEEEE